jgi:hypothetical protein
MKCCICKTPIIGYGHNPDPFGRFRLCRCCDICNDTVVIPGRLALIGLAYGKKKKAEEPPVNDQ